jgi:adenosylhomocysteine nucleosidase
MNPLRVGVLGAMEPEIGALTSRMRVERREESPGLGIWAGTLFEREVVVARCGMGKVAAAAGVQRLIDLWQVGSVVVCGLAGGLGDAVRLGDVVVGERYLQYDVDASPIFPRYQLPGLGVDSFWAPPRLVALAAEAVEEFLAGPLPRNRLASFGIDAPRLLRGLIVTGDRFVRDEGRDQLRRELPDALCVEMEGAAIAQVCHLNATPFVIVRVISDNADAGAPADFLRFVQELAPDYVLGIVSRLLARLG